MRLIAVTVVISRFAARTHGQQMPGGNELDALRYACSEHNQFGTFG
jgi:hypothetical protein